MLLFDLCWACLPTAGGGALRSGRAQRERPWCPAGGLVRVLLVHLSLL